MLVIVMVYNLVFTVGVAMSRKLCIALRDLINEMENLWDNILGLVAQSKMEGV